MICGSNFQGGKRRSADSYFFGLHVTVWGWASWRRAWRYYDVDMQRWPELRDTSWLADLLENPTAANYWHDAFEGTFKGDHDTWDWQLFFSLWSNDLLALIPDRNLISNIGFGDSATRTQDALPTLANLPLRPMEFPLVHPARVVVNQEADKFSFKQICPWIIENQNLYWKLRHKLSTSFPDPLRQKVRQLRTRLRGQ